MSVAITTPKRLRELLPTVQPDKRGKKLTQSSTHSGNPKNTDETLFTAVYQKHLDIQSTSVAHRKMSAKTLSKQQNLYSIYEKETIQKAPQEDTQSRR